MRHFFPDFNRWLDGLPDTRDQDLTEYDRRFLAWWGIALYLSQLGARRQLGFDPDAQGACVPANLSRLAQARQTTRPVHDTLDHFLGHVVATAFAELLLLMVRRLIRMKALGAARLLGHLVVIIDGTGLLCSHRRHCDHCLVQRHEHGTPYLHQVLGAKLLGPAGVALPVGSELTQNAGAAGAQGQAAERVKQDCRLKAFSRLAPKLSKAFPQASLVLAGDSLFACGRVLDECLNNDGGFVPTFKGGHLPALWQDYQGLLPLCPRNVLQRAGGDGTRRVYRWVPELSYQDSHKRLWRPNALECVEARADGVTRFVWLTRLPVSAKAVEETARKGGRYRWKVESEGFNRQKNSGLSLEHVSSTDPERWKAYYYLLQIAFVLIQLLERGSLLRRLAEQAGARTAPRLYGRLKNMARRLLESLRYCRWPQECFDEPRAASLHIGLVGLTDDTS